MTTPFRASTKLAGVKRLVRPMLIPAGLCAAVLVIVASTSKPPAKLVAHEWGTFTSVQGGDGELLEWQPQVATDLPGFVYNWARPGLKNASKGQFGAGKNAFLALQRMETPVIYFYTDTSLTMDVSVLFPQGLITEWYPQASDAGPSTTANQTALRESSDTTRERGLLFPPASTTDQHLQQIGGSKIVWKRIRILSESDNVDFATKLPTEDSTNHYFAARVADAALVQVCTGSTDRPLGEVEKFLFYRGIGRFSTPLRVAVSEDGQLTLTNNGEAPLGSLFVMEIRNGQGRMTALRRLETGEQLAVSLESSPQPTSAFIKQASRRLEYALVSEGLFRREAEAMVDTWQASWFGEPGLRVIYVLPRQWTDATLPLGITPKPDTVVRVMVGRAEIIAPTVQHQVAELFSQSQAGNILAKARMREVFEGLGRFAQPAISLALRDRSFSAEDRARMFAAAPLPYE